MDHEKLYDEFWKDLVENPDGLLDRDKVMRELSDYHHLMKQATEVYDHVSGSRISKPNTMAFEVINQADERVNELIETEVRESPAAEFARWIISLDDPDGPGYEARRSVTMGQIIGKAREALNLPEEV